jgi:arylsulfatase A-like enzyme
MDRSSSITRNVLGCLGALSCLLWWTGPHTVAADEHQNEPPRRPNVVFLLSDDQQPDTIHALGNERIHTPNLDRLVRTGTAFTRAICANPICTPSRAEILTGCSGFRNGTLDFDRPIDPELPHWAQTMRDAGYHTWYVGKWHNDGLPTQRGYEETRGLFMGGGGRWAVPTFDWNGKPVTGYRGWIFRSDDGRLHPERGVGLSPNISQSFADAAIELIQRKPDRPFFLHVNFTAPHDPLLLPFGYEALYDPEKMPVPKNFLPEHPFDHGNFRGRDEQLFEWPRTEREVRRELAVYYAVISHMDEQIGRILKALEDSGQSDDTLVIYSSDHGLAVGQHGLRGKQNMYEHTLGVPLIFSGPGIARGELRSAQCYLRDLYPTVCDLAGIPIPPTVEGQSLKPVLTGEKAAIYPHVFGYFRNVQRAVRTDRWKLIHYPQIGRYQLFDLEHDPDELNDLSADPRHAATRAELQQTLAEWGREVMSDE